MNNFKTTLTIFIITFFTHTAHADTLCLESELDPTNPYISYPGELDGGFLSRWWDMDYPILYQPGPTDGPWGGRGPIIIEYYREVALKSLVQEFNDLLDLDYATPRANTVYINQKSIVDGPLVITKPTVCHLQESVTAACGQPALIVAADDVIINLNKCTIHGCGVGADAIVVERGVKGVTICNGKIRDAGADGIHIYPQTNEINLINLDIKGCLDIGCFVGANRLVILDCEATYNQNAAFNFGPELKGARWEHHIINVLANHTGNCAYPKKKR